MIRGRGIARRRSLAVSLSDEMDDLRPQYPSFPFVRLPEEGASAVMTWLGLDEPFPARQVCDRRTGTAGWFLCRFHDRARIAFDGRLRRQPAGTTVLWAPGQRHYYASSARPFSHSYVFVAGPSADRLARACGAATNRPLAGVDRGALDYYIYGLIVERLGGRSADSEVIENLLANLLALVGRSYRGQADPVDPRVARVKRMLDRHFDRPFALADLAGEVHVSVPHLCELFQGAYRTSPMAYLQGRRLQQARYLLHDRSLSIAQIARRVGYDDPKYFSRVFRRHVGTSPTAFRRQHG